MADPSDPTSTTRRHGTTRSTTDCTRPRSSRELRRRYRGFVFPATVAFLAWYLLYVVMSNWAHDFMSHEARRQHQRRAWSSGCSSSSPRSCSPGVYASFANKQARPAGRASSTRTTRRVDAGGEPHERAPDLLATGHQALTTILFLAVVALTVGITFWASRQTSGAADYYAGGRGFSRLPERPRHRRRLHVGGVVPRHLRRHRAVRLRRLPLLDRLPGRLAGRAAAGRRAAAQLRAATRWPTSSPTG